MNFWDGMTAFFDTLPEAVMIFRKGRLQYANPPARTLVGEKQDMAEICGCSIPDTETSATLECVLGGQKGTLALSSIAEGEAQALVTRFTPEADNAEGDAALRNLLSSVSGELRESMSIISMSLELLIPQIENQGNPKLNSYLAMLCQHQRRIQRIAGNIGCFCELGEGSLHLELEKFDLVDLCATLVAEVQSLWDNRKRRIRFLSGLNALYTLGDTEKIKRMLFNLISNSMKYTADDGEISLSLAMSEDRIQLTVSDNGVGMPPEVLSSVFRNFEKQPILSEAEMDVGLGLGLPIANGIARLHGGTLVIESRPGQGTRVTIALRKWPDGELELHEEVLPYGPTAQRVLLTELADVLSYTEYMPRMLD